MEEGEKVLLVGREAAEQRTVKAVACLAHEAQKEASEEAKGGEVENWWILDGDCFVVGFGALDRLDFDNIGLGSRC